MLKNSQKHFKILGVKVNSTPKEKLLEKIFSNLSKFDSSASYQGKFFITTPNPEQLMLAKRNRLFSKILNYSTYSLPDGVGLVAAYKFLTLPKAKNFLFCILKYFAQGLGVLFSIIFDRKWLESDLKVIKGRDFFIDLIKEADKRGWRIFLLGDRKKSAQACQEVLSKRFKNVKFFSHIGPNLNLNGKGKIAKDKKIEERAVFEINKARPHLLFVGFGAPKQEKWMYRLFNRINVGGVMVVGGTFDYISGRKKLPPRIFENLGLEWLWRLLTGSQRWERIKVALIDFPLMVFFEKLESSL